MVKQRRSRQKPHKTNPTGLPSIKDFSDAVEMIENKRTLQNVFDDVQSCNLEEKLSALQTLASMSCDSSVAKQIAKNGIARIIGPLLVDPNAAIRANTASTLRDIADNGREDAHADLLKDDVMTPLSALIKQYYSDWQSKGRKDKDIRDEEETFIQAVGLLWSLCAHNETAVKRANDEDLVSLLLKFLDIDMYGIQIVSISIQCLVCLSDENVTAITKIKRNESTLLCLLDLKANDKNISKVLSLKTSIADLLINISKFTDSNWTHVLCKVLSILSEVLVIDHIQLLSSLTSMLPHENNASTSEKKNKILSNKTMLETQEQALQILANLCFEDEDTTDSDSEVMEIEPDCPDDDSMNDNLKMTSTLPVELVEVVSNCNLIDIIWKKSSPVVDKDSQEILEQNVEGKAVLKQFHDIRCTAYLCLNNLLPSLEIDVFGGIDNLYRKWLDIGAIVFNNQDNSDDTELLEAASAAMRAILQQLVEVRAKVFKVLTVSDIQPMLNNKLQYSNASVRVNIIRMLCNLVQILMNNEISENYEMIKHVSIFLLGVCTAETQAWVVAESIDALIDIFSEDTTDHLAVDIKLIPRLQSLIPQFKNKVRQQKNKSSNDGKSVISIVNTNLTRFIKYKEKRIRNLIM